MKPYLLPGLALLAGLGVAIGIATAPGDVLNGAVDRSGIAALVPAAASPVGVTGRTLLALAAGGLVALLGFATRLKLVLLTRAAPRRAGAGEAPLVVRRADAHPDAPPRRPIRASSDLGAPLPIFGPEERAAAPVPPPSEQPLPANLDQPMGAFDPAALPRCPREPVRAVAPLTRVVAPVETEEPVVVPMQECARPIAEDHHGEGGRGAGGKVTLPEIVPDEPVETITPVPSIVDAAPTIIIASSTPEPARVRPPLPVAIEAVSPDEQDDSIAGLLARLERGTARRQPGTPAIATPAPPPVPATLDETLQRLRRLATG